MHHRAAIAFTVLVALLIGFIPALVRAEAKAPDDVEFSRDVVYGKGGGEDLKLDLARPKTRPTHPAPCVVVIHGGGWSAGKRQDLDNVTWELARRGYVATTIEYRLAPAHRFPAQVEDAKCAVRFLRAHAKDYGIDADRIGTVGFSAGAHLAMMLGVTKKEDGLEGEGGWADQSSRVQAVVSFFGPVDLLAADLPPVSIEILRNFLGGTAAAKHDDYRRASPLTYVRSDAAPMLLLQGTSDPLVPWTQATAMTAAMTKAGAEGRVELLVGQGHGWGDDELRRTAEEAFQFFDAKLEKSEKAK